MKAWILAGGVGAAAMLVSSAAHATGSAVWWVDVGGASCATERGSLEREVMLACAAVGDTCRVAHEKKDAELVAVVACGVDSEASWTLETRTAEGAVLGSTELGGTREDRMREAAMEVARDAAPERTLAIESLRYNLSDADHAPPPAPLPRLAIGAAGRASLHGTVAPSGGGSGFIALRAVGPLEVLGRFAMEGGGSGFEEYRDVRGSIGLGWGAPINPTSIFGVAFGAGVESIQSYVALGVEPAGSVATQSRSDVAPFADATFIIQWPAGEVRPFAALSTSLASHVPELAAAAELGVTIGIF